MIEVIDGLAAGRVDDARQLLFEYMAETEAAAGRPAVSTPAQLPGPLRDELADPRNAFPPPGTVLLALRDGEPVGCLAFHLVDDAVAEFKRFYVRPAERRSSAARALIEEGARLARTAGVRRVTGDVLATRESVIAWYLRLGFTETPTSRVGPMGLVELERSL